MKNRIDTLRGCACVLLVVYHVIGSEPTNGLRIGDGVLRTANDMLALVRMPLFAMIAGWVYALKPLGAGSARNFLWRKSKRLLIPMVSVGTVFIVVQSLTPGVNSVHSGIPFIWPVAHFWFLEAIFLIFIFVVFLDAKNELSTFKNLASVFATACLGYLFGSPVQIFAIGGAVYLLPFFLLGVAVGRFPDRIVLLTRPLAQTALVILVAFALLRWDLTGDRHTTLYLAVGVALCSIAAGTCMRSRALIFLAKYSFAIYLFHVFFTAGSRIVLERAGVTDLAIHFATGVIAGLVGPMLLQVWLERRPIANFLLFGKQLPERAALIPKHFAPLNRQVGFGRSESH